MQNSKRKMQSVKYWKGDDLANAQLIPKLMRQLADLHARAGDGVEPAGRQTLVTGEEAINGVILLDIAFADVQIDNATGEVEGVFEQSRGNRLIGSKQVELMLMGGAQNF